jgi:hypothetical protein
MPIPFVLSFLLLGFVVVRAALTRSDDTSRLRAATAKIDQALGLLPADGATGTGPYHTRFTSIGRREARLPLAARLLGAGALRASND